MTTNPRNASRLPHPGSAAPFTIRITMLVKASPVPVDTLPVSMDCVRRLAFDLDKLDNLWYKGKKMWTSSSSVRNAKPLSSILIPRTVGPCRDDNYFVRPLVRDKQAPDRNVTNHCDMDSHPSAFQHECQTDRRAEAKGDYQGGRNEGKEPLLQQ